MKKTLFTILIALLPVLAYAFEADKFYTIHRNGEASSYIYQDGETMSISALQQNSPAYIWQFVPTADPDVYYIRNVGSDERSIASSSFAFDAPS